MKYPRLATTTALASASLLLAAAPAWAQAVEEEQADAGALQSEQEIESGEEATDGEEVVVTGSRIRRPNLVSTVPVTSVGGEEFFETGQTSVGDVLNELPALRSTFGQSNSTRFIGTAGLSLLDLRGLATQRTLVLVNGRRHVAGDILNNATSPDVNTFPTDLIERVDIVTGGNSAIYGSDAIAGVVNFVTKRNFEGVQLRAQSGISPDYRDAGAYFIAGIAGTNFADGRGNIAIAAEYAHQNQYFASGRPLESQDAFIVVDTDTATNSDGTPDRRFFRDVRSATLNNTGLVRFGGNVRVNGGTDASGAFFNRPFAFQPDGTLVPVTGTRIGIGPNGSFVGGNGENFRTGTQFQLTPKLDRYTINAVGRFEVSEAFEPFFDVKYSRTDTLGTGNSGPAFITGTTLGDIREQPLISNPFLTDQARALIISQITASSATGTAPTDATRFSLRENLVGLGARNERAIRETYRGVAGIRGKFNDDWSYELSANYGEFKERTRVGGNLNVQRFLLAVDAVRNPANGQIVCNSQINPDARIPYNTTGSEALLAADVAACTPVNLFGGNFTDAQRNYLLANTTSVGKITQFVGQGNLAGDLSQLFELPGGPIGFAIGAEYRRETNFFQADPLVEQGYTFYNALSALQTPSFEVGEVYGEIRAPLLRDTFIKELSVSGAGRVAKYKGATGTVVAWNAGLDFAPIDDIRFRAAYSRSVRAPNLVEQFSAVGQNFATVDDPCSLRNRSTGSATRAANCASQGIPAAFDFVYSGSLEIRSGGNPDLQAETSNSFTVGGVARPSFIPGLSLSVDYFNIRVNNVISAVDAQTILDQCYDQATTANQFCASFARAGAAGGPSGEVPFQILEGSLLQSQLNFAKLQSRGIDAELVYRRNFGFGAASTRLSYTRTLTRNDFLNPADPTRADRLLQELGDPRDEFNFNIDVKSGAVNVGYRLRFIGKQVLNTYEDLFSVQGREPENADYAELDFYPDVFYHNIRVGVDVNDKFNFYGGVDNFTNKMPPFGLTGIGGGSGIYDNRGRFAYVGAVAKF